MRVGTLCYATDQGLGILAKAFHVHGVVTDVFVVHHARYPTHDEWYPGGIFAGIRVLKSHPVYDVLRGFCRAMDVVLFFETPFDWDLIPFCREHGVKTAIMPMHECMPDPIPHQPDLLLCPSELDLLWADRLCARTLRAPNSNKNPVFIPTPVEIPWRQRDRAVEFVHNAGHGGLRGRNGTAELIEAMWYVNSPAQLLVRTQERIEAKINHKNTVLRQGTIPFDELWEDGDVFVFPEKFNGLSLPLQEARAAGMLVVATDRFPMNEWLPREPLIPASGSVRSRIGPAYCEFDEAVIRPQDIAAKLDEWHGRDIRDYSLAGKFWAEKMSWDVLKPKYVETLERLCA